MRNALQQLAENAAQAPHVDGGGVAAARHDHFRGAARQGTMTRLAVKACVGWTCTGMASRNISLLGCCQASRGKAGSVHGELRCHYALQGAQQSPALMI